MGHTGLKKEAKGPEKASIIHKWHKVVQRYSNRLISNYLYYNILVSKKYQTFYDFLKKCTLIIHTILLPIYLLMSLISASSVLSISLFPHFSNENSAHSFRCKFTQNRKKQQKAVRILQQSLSYISIPPSSIAASPVSPAAK